jgi:hypothetical protein
MPLMDLITEYRRNKPNIECNLLVFDNFYKDPMTIREFALKQEYFTDTYYPGKRTKSFATIEIKNRIQNFIEPFAGKIIDFPLYTADNGSFQYTTSNDTTWIHTDSDNMNWGGILYLTPDAPLNSGTSFYKYKNGTIDYNEKIITNTEYSHDSKDTTKWDIIDQVGNVFNRLVLFNSTRFHSSSNYFGKDVMDGRLFQVFFFKAEYP